MDGVRASNNSSSTPAHCASRPPLRSCQSGPGHAALHQWKEAQAELLRVVKVDRTSKVGFTLLGEVLMRRADYERATPVLQHAQNLDPSNPAVLALLRAARSGAQLDPPAPIPTPIAPRCVCVGAASAGVMVQPASTARTRARRAVMVHRKGGP